MVIIPEVSYTCNGRYVCLGRTEFGKYAEDSDEVVYKAASTDFEVTVNGKPCQVRDCRVSAMPFNRPWPGKQRPYSQSEWAGFVSVSADEALTFRVKRKKDFSLACVRPLSKNVETDIIDGEVVFVLKEYGSYVLEFGDTHNVLHIFFDPIKEYPEAKNATLYFGRGMHFPGVINLRDNDTVYIDREAIVFGSIFARNVKNVKIFGGGIIDNSCEERLAENGYEEYTKGTFRIYGCTDIEVSDIILTNSSTWALSMFSCSRITVDSVKIVGHWRYNTDGIDVVNSDNVNIRNCFIRSFDDTVSIKAIYDHPKPIENVTVDNCVLWCGWGKTCEIGIETSATEYKNIVFKNCDAIHNASGVMTVSNGNHADMHSILFENVNVELQKDTELQVLQTADGQKYDDGGQRQRVNLIVNSNEPYAIRQISRDKLVRGFSDRLGNIHDVTYRNLRIFTDDPQARPIIRMVSVDNGLVFRNFRFENVYINGERVKDLTAFETELKNVEDIYFN